MSFERDAPAPRFELESETGPELDPAVADGNGCGDDFASVEGALNFSIATIVSLRSVWTKLSAVD